MLLLCKYISCVYDDEAVEHKIYKHILLQYSPVIFLVEGEHIHISVKY